MKRFAKGLKRFALWMVGIVAVLLLVSAFVNYRANSRLEKKIKALRDAGEPVSLADLAPSAIPPDKNAVTYLRRAKADVRAIQTEVEAAVSASSEEDQERFYFGRLTPEIKRAIESAFAAYPGALGLIEQAAACDDYGPPLDYTTDVDTFREAEMESGSAAREVIRVLNYRAKLQVADGKFEDALRTCIVMFRLSRLMDHEPLMTGYLMSLACRGMTVSSANLALRGGPISPELRAELEAERALHETTAAYQHAWVSERASGLQGFRAIKNQLNYGPLGLPWVMNDAASYLDVVAERLATPDETFAATIKELESSPAVAGAGTLTRLMIPANRMMIEATCRTRAQLRALRVLNALGRRAGDEEPKLSELGLPVVATTDPFDGQPLQMKRLPDGWLIYAVGPNLKDDGGKLNTDAREDAGLGPPSVAEAPRQKFEPKAAAK
jgi:hypothetical protein